MKPKVVWILGAGFSKSLGGPLLDDLLRPDCLRGLGATFSRDKFPLLHGALPEAVIWLYHFGRRFSAGKRSGRIWELAGEGLWRDAEEFLDFVDSATTSSTGPAALQVQAILHQYREELFGNGAVVPELSEVRGMARRLIAAECSAFLQNADLATERWGPYLRWARELVQAGDGIVTFNYDVVLEHLCRATKHMTVLLPEASPASNDQVYIVKLHGSVNWRRKPPGVAEVQDLEAAICCRCDQSELTIATPGQTKTDHAKQYSNLWTLMERGIQNADALVFLGYRFPPSDAESRRRILGAVRSNRNEYLAIHTVLGPDVRRPDSARLDGLLHHAMSQRYPSKATQNRGPHGDVIQQPLFVEDFLSVVERDAVMTPARQPGLRSTHFS